jgi:pectin methylesterase-like acyl-CoA thioesterase
MRHLFVCLAGVLTLTACSKAPAPTAQAASAAPASAAAPAVASAAAPSAGAAAPIAAGAALAGSFTVDGKPAALTQASAHKDDPFDDQPITAIVFTAKDQAGDAKAADDALFGNFGDTVVVKVEPDGTVIGADVRHSALKNAGSVSISGVMTMKDYKVAGGVVSGHLTSNGPTDVFGQSVNVDLTFHTPAPQG